MTRDYNKPGRDNVRPYSRPHSSYRQEEERSPRSPRPRLNRESVDRAWESGAPTQHADYRTRNQNNQAPRNGWRDNQQTEHSPAHNGRKPFGNRQDGNRRFDRNANGGYTGNRSRSFDTEQHATGDRRNDYRDNTGGFKRFEERPERNNSDRPNGQRPPFRGQEQRRSYPQRPYERNDRPSHTNDRPARGFERNDRPPRPAREFEHDGHNERPARSFERDNRSTRNFERGNRESREDRQSGGSRPPRNFERDNRYGSRSQPQERDTRNPRWQSRPQQTEQRNRSFQKRSYDDSPQEHFEGDYERFNAPQHPRQQGNQGQQEDRQGPATRRPFQDRRAGKKPFVQAKPEEKEERHVTRLPDGRVLKGPRPAQRKNAQFWTDVAKETDNLIEHVETPPVPSEPETQDVEKAQLTQEARPLDSVSDSDEQAPQTPRKPRSRVARAITHSKRIKVKGVVVKPRSVGPKPSKRGFKWPTP